jgi:hypothetical protein
MLRLMAKLVAQHHHAAVPGSNPATLQNSVLGFPRDIVGWQLERME